MNRVEYEISTVTKMISIYCKAKHKSRGEELCESCNSLKVYATSRLEKCKYSNEKPNCKDCKTHCYKTTYKEEMKRIMRFSGPRMILYHPADFIIHLKFKKKFR